MTGSSPAKPFLSLCMIVKNEREHLPRCLQSAQPYVDEMVVVDTGSEDGTPEIAASLGAKVGYFEWCNDFAAARNYALSLVRGAWVLVLDADEELLVEGDFRADLAQGHDRLAYTLIRTEAQDAGMTPLHHVRVFRNLPELRYEGRFHEQVKYQGHWLPETTIGHLKSLKMVHYGNTDDRMQQKTLQRNIPILEATRREEGLSLMLLYCLAGMYADGGQVENAQGCYSEAFERLLPNLLEGNLPEDVGFLPSLLYVLAAQALQQEDYETARLLCQRGVEWCPTFPPLNYATGVLLRAMGFLLGAIAYFEQCLHLGQTGTYYTREPFDFNYMTVFPACDLGNVYLSLGRLPEAMQAFEQALAFDPNCAIAQQTLEVVRGRMR